MKKILLILAMLLVFASVASAEHGSGAGGITPTEHGLILW